METTAAWVAEQKKEDIFDEIIYNSKKTNLQHLRSVGWNGFPDRLRAPSWQLLLHYIPATASKRKTALRRRRNEYHRQITKCYFEFDFCLTDRMLSCSRALSWSGRETNDNTPKRRVSISRKKALSRKNSNPNLLPLFSQSQSRSQRNLDLESTSLTREDSLLQQVRRDIDRMVKVPTSSIAARKADKRSAPTSFPPNIKDFNGESATTKNRLFSCKSIKESLERIIYLWCIRVEGNDLDASQYTSRYVAGLVDIVYPLYITNLHGYIWETHISTSSRAEITTVRGDPIKAGSTRSLFSNKSTSSTRSVLRFLREENESDTEDDEEQAPEPKIYEDEERQNRLRRCQHLAIGLGLHEIPEEILEEVEADTFWCLENFMTAIQDYRQNNAFAPIPKKTTITFPAKEKPSYSGMQEMIILIEKVTERKDPQLYKHLKAVKVEFIWFTFRWINSLHVRDLNEECLIRLWDTCMCEEVGRERGSYFTRFGFSSKRAKKRLHLVGFLNFQVYICVALLCRLRNRVLVQKTMEGILFELRNPSLEDWELADVEMLVSEAYLNQEIFRGSEEQMLASASEQYGEKTITTWVQKCHWPPRKQAAK
uniref:Rab-GAP TBC domain-containing protein n=1 Tax=Chaetoceros debilis TaxID=122233 RepID=A0A7S3V639_9STRA